MTIKISQNFDCLREGQGLADRATFIVDPQGVIQAMEITAEGIGRNAAELIRKGELSAIKDAMEQSLTEGSQTFEQALYHLYRSGEVELDEALRNADSATNLSWMVNNAQTVDEREQQVKQKPDTTPDQPGADQGDTLMFDTDLH